MTETMTPEPTQVRRPSFLKPSTKTPFHIDFDWWKENERDWQVYLRSLLCTQHQDALATLAEGQMIDWVDEITAEVKQVDGIQHALMSHCARQPEFITAQTALVEAVFRVFLVNGNQPLSAEDLSARLKRPANTILSTLGGSRIYKGLRPVQ